MHGMEFQRMRLAIGVSQRKLARWFSVDEKTIQFWENGYRPVPGSAAALMSIIHDEQVNHNPHAVRDYVNLLKAVKEEEGG